MTKKRNIHLQYIPLSRASRNRIHFWNITSRTDLDKYIHPLVLTVNPGTTNDWAYIKLKDIPKHLMYVRVNTNTWNLPLVHGAVHWYDSKNVPVVLSFLEYKDYHDIPQFQKDDYYRDGKIWRIKTLAWLLIMARFRKCPRVYSCGQEGLSDKCSDCGNCLREYFNTMERLSV